MGKIFSHLLGPGNSREISTHFACAQHQHWWKAKNYVCVDKYKGECIYFSISFPKLAIFRYLWRFNHTAWYANGFESYLGNTHSYFSLFKLNWCAWIFYWRGFSSLWVWNDVRNSHLWCWFWHVNSRLLHFCTIFIKSLNGIIMGRPNILINNTSNQNFGQTDKKILLLRPLLELIMWFVTNNLLTKKVSGAIKSNL